MPRTLDSLVECHVAVRERAKAGIPPWDGELTFLAQVGPLFERFNVGEDTLTAQDMLDGFHGAAKEVRASIPAAQVLEFSPADADLEAFVTTLEGWNLEFVENCPDIQADFTRLLDRLYDWCDANRWWIKPAP